MAQYDKHRRILDRSIPQWSLIVVTLLLGSACGGSDTSSSGEAPEVSPDVMLSDGAESPDMDVAIDAGNNTTDTGAANTDTGQTNTDTGQTNTDTSQTKTDTSQTNTDTSQTNTDTSETDAVVELEDSIGSVDASIPEDTPSPPEDLVLSDIPFNPSESPNDFEHIFHHVEQPGPSEFLYQTLVIDLPDDFVDVEAQISIRGDLDNFPGAFMTFVVESEGKLKQCGNVSGLPQKPNHILDDQFRIAFPFPENIFKQSVFYPPSPPYDFQPLPCAEWFQGKSEIEIGMLGIGIYPPGVSGNQGVNACGGAGCPNDAIVKLRFVPPTEETEICVAGEIASCFCSDGSQSTKTCLEDQSDYSQCDCVEADTSTSDPPDSGGIEEPVVYGSCADPAALQISAASPTAEVTLPGTAAVHAWPAIDTPCPMNKPPDSIETFYQLTVTDYGILHLTMPDYDPPWAGDQYYLDLQSACGVMGGLDCGSSKEPMVGVAQPGDYLVALTQAPNYEIYIPEQDDWSFTLRAELIPLEWSQENTVFNGNSISLSRNNTPASQRDSAGRLHALWSEEGILHHGVRDPSGMWLTSIVDTQWGGTVTHPTIDRIDGIGMVMAWEELSDSGASAIFAAYSVDLGMSWSLPLEISAADAAAHAPALLALPSTQSNRLIVGWHDEVTHEIKTRGWTGGGWTLGDWDTAEVVDQTDGASRHVSLATYSDGIVAAWEDEGSSAARIHFAKKEAGGSWSTGAAVVMAESAALSNEGHSPSLQTLPSGEIYLAWDSNQTVALAFSHDGGDSFSAWGTAGIGHQAQVVADAANRGALAWTRTMSAEPDPGAVSMVGLAISPDSFEHLLGPSILPGTGLAPPQSKVSINFRYPWLDVFWVETDNDDQSLKYRSLQFL